MLQCQFSSSIIQICTTSFREPSRCDESSCLRMLLDKRDLVRSMDSWKTVNWLFLFTNVLKDWFEDELRSFQGGKDGVLTCVWENGPPSFPQDNKGMLSFLGMVYQCLKAERKIGLEFSQCHQYLSGITGYTQGCILISWTYPLS